MAKSIHAVAIFLGAFLLFQIQPLMGKFLLPWFGGGPGVWTTCLLFFQTLLVGGYAYAHWLTNVRPLRRQAGIHLSLLVVSLAMLPIAPGAFWKPTAGTEPVTRILLLLLATVGLPYLLLAATGPLFQRWASLKHAGLAPYRLYALSNAGSLLALLSFPFCFEPLFSRQALSWGWSAGLVAFTGLCAAFAWRQRKIAEPNETAAMSAEFSPPPGWSDRLWWLALPATAALLLAATTNKLCLDIAALPFVWVLPLGTYLLSFILCFDHPRWYDRRCWSAGFAVGCGASALCLVDTAVSLPLQLAVFNLTLLAAGMLCHGELYRLRPAPARLTGYYLTIAAGGALGTGFTALLAPLLFTDYRELPIGLVLLAFLLGLLGLSRRSLSLSVGTGAGLIIATFVIPALMAETGRGALRWFEFWGREILTFYTRFSPAIAGVVVLVYFCLKHRGPPPAIRPHRMVVLPLLFSVLLGVVFIRQAKSLDEDLEAAGRNFYGAYKVQRYGVDDPRFQSHLLTHGGTTHGLQFLHPNFAHWQTTYYGPTSGVARAISTLPGKRRVGLIGLGAGTLAGYGRRGDVFRFYEIDPAIVHVAREYFTYLKASPAVIEIAPGDARLSLEAELQRGQQGRFDLLVLDAFNGDAIPIHLLTHEAMDIYRQHLRSGGLIAVHISNRHLDLRPVVEALAQYGGMHFATISDNVPKQSWWAYDTKWMILCAEAGRLDVEAIGAFAEEPPDATAQVLHWTDDHASLLKILK